MFQVWDWGLHSQTELGKSELEPLVKADSLRQGTRDGDERSAFSILITYICIYISTVGFE